MDSKVKRVLIIGGGEAGAMVIKELLDHKELSMKPVAVIDDDKTKQGTRIYGVVVVGGRGRIMNIVKTKKIHEIIIAMPSVSNSIIHDIIEICKETKCRLKRLPGVYEWIDDQVIIQQIRDVDIEDLLGREPVRCDLEAISHYIKDQVILVTGAGGSIGSELCRQIAVMGPLKLVILDNYENNAFYLEQELHSRFPQLDLKVCMGSIQDATRINQIFSDCRPTVVFHAAAHKHVPLMEANPTEAIKNNIFGTLHVAEAADRYGATKFVLISTDKAVNPTNIMGATKRVAEMIIQAMDKHSATEYTAVRFGNVLGSNGSVLTLFRQQIERGGPLTVTHPEVTRFFMTIPEAVQLVIQAGALAKGGEIFVLDMGSPVRIMDLARDYIRLSGLEPDKDIQIEIIGLRPGEKLYEELLLSDEGLQATTHHKIFIGQPTFSDLAKLKEELEQLSMMLAGNQQELIACMQRLVPTYTSAFV